MTPAELTQAREELGLTMAELAARLGVHERTIRRHEKGEWPIPPERVLAVKWLLHEQNTKAPN